jgi:SSS family transporter
VKLIDWVVLAGTLTIIVGYGLWKTRGVKSAEAWLRGGSDVKWWTIGLSIMATQASAITFLSTPGQAYEDGMGFVQFYFGLPVAMVVLSATIVPLFHKLKVYTAYEYLESRFDLKTRQLTAFLFLVQRGLAAGLSIYAPAIILSTVLGWSLQWTNIVIGTLVIVYTVSGGTRAVNQTQTWQMAIMLGGMALALAFTIHRLPEGVSTVDAVRVAGALGRMNVVDYSLRLDTRYTFWSGMTGGLFVALAYFGTDQSQVQRYLAGGSLTESRYGLLMNGLVKVPMQFFILFVGLMVFAFYQFERPPVFFNQAELDKVYQTDKAPELRRLESEWTTAFQAKSEPVRALVAAEDPAAADAAREKLRAADARMRVIREDTKKLIASTHARAEVKDADYIFLRFVTHEFPAGLVGLLLAVIFCAAMSASASALNALGSTTVIDFYKRLVRPDASDAHYLLAAKLFTTMWGIAAIAFAASASLFDNLIQAVNILGSLFYGPMLGVFLVGFFFKRVGGNAVFIATIVAQVAVLATWKFTGVSFLWYNVVGSVVLVVVALGAQALGPRSRATPA